MADLADLSSLPSLTQHPAAAGNPLGAELEALEKEFELEDEKASTLFEKADKDNNGSLSPAELRGVLKALKLDLSESDFDRYSRKLFAKLDKNSDGKLSKSEFKVLYKEALQDKKRQAKHKAHIEKKYQKRAQEAEAEAMFKHYDTNGNGTIEKRELRPLLETLAVDLTEAQFHDFLNAVFHKADQDGSGQLDLKEFKRFFEKCLSDDHIKEKYERKVKQRYLDQQAEIEALFTLLDADDSGTISTTELSESLTTCGYDQETVLAMFRKYDRNADGQITMDEFTDMAYLENLRKRTAFLLKQ